MLGRALPALLLVAGFGCGGDNGTSEGTVDGGEAVDGGCDDTSQEIFAQEDWYIAAEGADLVGDTWDIETEFSGHFTMRIFEPPPPHRPVTHWLDDVAVYSGGIALFPLFAPFEDEDVVIVGKTGQMCTLGPGEPDFCIQEIWPASIRRQCPP